MALARPQIPIRVLSGSYAVCRLDAGDDVPGWAQGPLVSITRTPAELSIVCPIESVPAPIKAERGWRVLALQGPLDFALIGVVSSIAAPLASAGMSIFVISTYDTDYILVRENDLERALYVLRDEGFEVR